MDKIKNIDYGTVSYFHSRSVSISFIHAGMSNKEIGNYIFVVLQLCYTFADKLKISIIIMTLQDFIKEKDFNSYVSRECFWFENKKVGFWYRIYLTSYTYQPGWDDRMETKYQVLLVVDDESIHSNHKLLNDVWDKIRFGFFLKETIKRGKFDEEYMEKILNSALKLKIENKIKENRYQKILGIINGTSFYH